MKNIVIFGCRKITTDVIDFLLKDGDHNVCCVISQDEERDRVYGDILVGEFCKANGIREIRIDGKIDKDLISSFNPDIVFSLYYRKILKKEILEIPKMGCINIHPALLPEGRGPAPSLWNVLNGDKYAGTTIHYMEEGVDAGDIIDQKRIKINGMTGFELNLKLMNLGFDLFKDNFYKIINGTNKRAKQNNKNATYCLPFVKSLRYVYWNYPDKILDQVRAFARPFDGAISWTNNKDMIIIWEAKVLGNRSSISAPGFYEKNLDGTITVQTCTLPILITKFDIIGNLKDRGRFVSGPPVQQWD